VKHLSLPGKPQGFNWLHFKVNPEEIAHGMFFLISEAVWFNSVQNKNEI
jgi:hypothetical protein